MLKLSHFRQKMLTYNKYDNVYHSTFSSLANMFFLKKIKLKKLRSFPTKIFKKYYLLIPKFIRFLLELFI